MHPLVLAAIGAGVLLSSYSILGRLGMQKGIHLLHISAVMGIGGGLWFLPFAIGEMRAASFEPPIWLAVLALANGAVRYLGMVLWDRALRMGPLSLLACATNLGFIITVPYVRLVHGQSSSTAHWCAVAMAALAVILAAKTNAHNDEGNRSESGITVLYLFVLVGAWLMGGAGNVIIKEVDLRHTPDGQTYIDAFGSFFWMLEYAGMGVLAALDCLVRRRRPGSYPLMVGMGLVALGASILAILFVRLGITLHPAVYFSAANVTTILFSVLVGALFFKEKRSVYWYLTVATSIAVVFVANAGT